MLSNNILNMYKFFNSTKIKLNNLYAQFKYNLYSLICFIYVGLSYIYSHGEYYISMLKKNIVLLGIIYLPDWVFEYINKLFKSTYKINILHVEFPYGLLNIYKHSNICIFNKLKFYFNWWQHNYEYIDVSDLHNLNIIFDFAIIYNNYEYLHINLLEKTYIYIKNDEYLKDYNCALSQVDIIEYIKKTENSIPFLFGLVPIVSCKL